MATPTKNRSQLFLGTGIAALAAALAVAPDPASAQAFQGTPTVTTGAAIIDRGTPGVDTISADTATVVIDWTPDEDVNGDALDFLPTGNTGIFQNNIANGVTDFAILNRILPATNGNIAVIDGTIISRIDNGAGFAPGGFVAFYSPTGILVGSNAVFDVGGLMLTTLDPDITSFSGFTAGGTMNLFGQTGTTAQIIISPGAQIVASPENSFFIAAAAEVQMFGTALVNGSHAYVGGEQVDVTLSNGLFDIVIPVGSQSPQPIHIEGDVGGPSSGGAGDNHIIYAVARAAANPITMLLRGNLGFDPAASAGIVNGEIIISANENVSGRTVAGASISDGLNAFYRLDDTPTDPQADIFIQEINVTSDLLALSTHNVRIDADNGNSTFSGNVYVAGADSARIDSANGNTIDIAGNVLAYSNVVGGNNPLGPGGLDATAGFAAIFSQSNGQTTIGGDVTVVAQGFAGFDGSTVGNATGGQAQIYADGGGLVDINGANVLLRAGGIGFVVGGLDNGGIFNGGLAEVIASQGGTVDIAGNVLVESNAIGTNLTGTSAGAGSQAVAGSAVIGTFAGNGNILIGGSAGVQAAGIAGSGGAATNGAQGVGGTAEIFADATGAVSILGAVTLDAPGVGATLSQFGTGGEGLGGRARSVNSGGTISLGSSFTASATGQGGDGSDGGNAAGGAAGLISILGTSTVTGNAFANASANGGNATIGFGGRGGDGLGGLAGFQATGDLTTAASVSIGGGATALAIGTGGTGGAGDGSTIAAGRGGDGTGGNQETINQADTNFSSAAFMLAGGDNGNLSIAGPSQALATGIGGQGGSGGTGQEGGDGGNGLGGDTLVGLLFLGGDGSLAAGTASYGDVTANANGIGGAGGSSGVTGLNSGTGGSGTGGESYVVGRIGIFVSGTVNNDADGVGGNGSVGGAGTGGIAGSFGSFGGARIFANYFSSARGFGGSGFAGAGGVGTGGESFLGFQDGSMLVNGNATVDASGTGGSSVGANGADGIGGIADMAVFTAVAGIGTIGGEARILANGQGGNANSSGFTGGTGTGGRAFAQAQAGGTVTFGALRIAASGQGGTGPSAVGGAGFGGSAEILSNDSGSQLIVQDVPNLLLDQFSVGGVASAIGIGGATTGGTGIGGTGTGGTVLVQASGGASIALPSNPTGIGTVRLLGRGIGGTSSVDGGAGGLAVGGSGIIRADGGTITTGPTQFSMFAPGGESADPAANISGGDGQGGSRLIEVINGGTLTGEFNSGVTGGTGGTGSGTGNGGNAIGGSNTILVDNGTLNIVGRSIFVDQAFGGQGHVGGTASGGTASLTVLNGGTVNIQANANGDAELVIGGNTFGGTGDVGGGNATGETGSVTVDGGSINGGTLSVNGGANGGGATSGPGGNGTAASATVQVNGQMNGTALNVSARGQGGSSGNGQSGNGTGGTASITGINATVSYGTANVSADGIGGVSTVGIHGDGTGGTAFIQLTGSDFATTGDTVVRATGDAGPNTAVDGSGGNAQGGAAFVDVFEESGLQTGNLDINSNAAALQDGTAEGGSSILRLVGGSVNTTSMVLSSVASSVGGSSATGGNVALALEPGVAVNSNLQAGTATFENGGSGSTTSTAGEVTLSTVGSNAAFDSLNVFSTGANGGAVMSWFANGGNIAINDSAIVQVTGGINITAINGALIGGPTVTSPTAFIDLLTDGRIAFNGNDDNAISFGGAVLSASATEIDINAGSRIGALEVSFSSLDTDNPAIIGGNTDEPGFTLTQDEAGRIEAGSFSFFGSEIDATDENQPDIIIRDITAFGSLDDGPSRIEIEVEDTGIVRVEGVVSYVEAGPDDEFEIEAGQRIEVVTPGGISITDSDGNPTGSLRLEAPNLWVADDDLISQLQSDPNFAGRNDILSEAAAGSDDPLGYLRAGSVVIEAAGSVLVRNTGTSEEPGGILVGEGGLSIASDPELSPDEQTSVPLDVFAYGRQRNNDGTFVTGEDFYRLVNFNRTDPDFPTEYVTGSKLNDCDINDDTCSNGATNVIEETAPPVNNPAVVEAAVTTVDPIVQAEEESNAEFGVDFPGLVEAPLLSEDPLLEDPVSSGGDSSLYALSDDTDEDDEDDEDDDQESSDAE